MASYDELAAMSVPALRDLAKGQGVRGYSRMRRPELLTAVAGALGVAVPTDLAAEAVAAEEAALAVVEPVSSAVPAALEPAAAPVEEGFELPFSYGVDQVVVLVRDPLWLYSYFDVSGDTWARLSARGITEAASGWRKVLRIHDVTGTVNGAPTTETWRADVDVADDSRDWYFQAPQSGRDYVIEFGWLSPDGEFVLVARSNVVTVPRTAPSDEMDESWGSLYDEAMRLSLAGGDPSSGGLTSADVRRRLEAMLSQAVFSGHFSGGPVWESGTFSR